MEKSNNLILLIIALIVLLIVLVNIHEVIGTSIWLLILFIAFGMYHFYFKDIGLRMSVEVKDLTDNPIKDARIQIKEGNSELVSSYTGSLGWSSLEFSPSSNDSNLKLVVEKEGYKKFEDSFTPEDTETKTVNLRKAITRNLSVNVLDEEGNQISGADVYAYQEGELRDQGKTESDGVVTFNLPEGTYKVIVKEQSYKDGEKRIDLRGEDKSTEIKLIRKQGKISIDVVDEYNTPISNAKIAIDSTNLTTDNGGHAESTIPSGSYALTVKDSDGIYKEKESTIEIKEEPTNFTVKLQLKKLIDSDKKYANRVSEVEKTVENEVSSPPPEWNQTLPNLYNALCVTIVELAKDLPEKNSIEPPFMDQISQTVNLITSELKRPEYRYLHYKDNPPVEFDVRKENYISKLSSLVRDPNSFLNSNSDDIKGRIDQLDQKVTQEMSAMDILPAANLWKISKKLIKEAEGKKKEEKATSYLLADIIIDYANEFFSEELKELLKK